MSSLVLGLGAKPERKSDVVHHEAWRQETSLRDRTMVSLNPKVAHVMASTNEDLR